MTRYGLVCIVLAGLAWAQSGNPSAPNSQSSQISPASASSSAAPATPVDEGKSVPLDAPVITFNGLCDYARDHKFTDPKCKTIITRREYDTIMELTHPNADQHMRRFLSKDVIGAFVKSQKALQMGLGTDEHFRQRVEVLRLIFYAKTLDQNLATQEWNKVTDKQIEDYYNQNLPQFEIGDVSCIFVPKFEPEDDDNWSAAKKKEYEDAQKQKLSAKAEELRGRALAGESFVQLQQEAYKFTGVTSVTGPNDADLEKCSPKDV